MTPTFLLADINECVNGTHDCEDAANFECVNTLGNFDCVCSPGYQLDGGNCVGQSIIFLLYIYYYLRDVHVII